MSTYVSIKTDTGVHHTIYVCNSHISFLSCLSPFDRILLIFVNCLFHLSFSIISPPPLSLSPSNFLYFDRYLLWTGGGGLFYPIQKKEKPREGNTRSWTGCSDVFCEQAVSRFTYGEERGCGGLINVTSGRGQVASLDIDRLDARGFSDFYDCVTRNLGQREKKSRCPQGEKNV